MLNFEHSVGGDRVSLESTFFRAADSGMVPSMKRSEEKTARLSPALTAILLVGLIVGYPLSAGPAVFILDCLGEPPLGESMMEAIYSPLDRLPTPILGPIAKWADFCDELAP